MEEDTHGVKSNFESALTYSGAQGFRKSDGVGGPLNEKKPKGQGKKMVAKWKKTRL